MSSFRRLSSSWLYSTKNRLSFENCRLFSTTLPSPSPSQSSPKVDLDKQLFMDKVMNVHDEHDKRSHYPLQPRKPDLKSDKTARDMAYLIYNTVFDSCQARLHVPGVLYNYHPTEWKPSDTHTAMFKKCAFVLSNTETTTNSSCIQFTCIYVNAKELYESKNGLDIGLLDVLCSRYYISDHSQNTAKEKTFDDFLMLISQSEQRKRKQRHLEHRSSGVAIRPSHQRSDLQHSYMMRPSDQKRSDLQHLAKRECTIVNDLEHLVVFVDHADYIRDGTESSFVLRRLSLLVPTFSVFMTRLDATDMAKQNRVQGQVSMDVYHVKSQQTGDHFWVCFWLFNIWVVLMMGGR